MNFGRYFTIKLKIHVVRIRTRAHSATSTITSLAMNAEVHRPKMSTKIFHRNGNLSTFLCLVPASLRTRNKMVENVINGKMHLSRWMSCCLPPLELRIAFAIFHVQKLHSIQWMIFVVVVAEVTCVFVRLLSGVCIWATSAAAATLQCTACVLP